MTLSDKRIKEYLDSGKIQILPDYREKDIRPAGIRVHLADEILVPEDDQTIDLDQPEKIRYKKISLSKSDFILNPNTFILGSTCEKIKMPRNIIGKIDGRSTIARLGIMIHCTSDTIDGNYDEARSIVFEIKNIGNFKIILKNNTPLGMIIFNELTSEIVQKSQSQYKNQNFVTPPNIKFQPGKDK